MLGDEMSTGGWPRASLVAASRLVHGKMAGLPHFVYTNEGSHMNGPVGWTSFPPELDFLSVDGYGVGAAEAEAQRAIYEKSIFPKLQPHQRAVAVPGFFGCSQKQFPQTCSNSSFERVCFCKLDCTNASKRAPGQKQRYNCSAAAQGESLVAKLDAYEAWAAREPRLAGLIPYKWETDGGNTVGAFELGGCAFPALQPALVKHGWLDYSAIMKCRDGKCRD
jgi:hypothetical protein